MKDLLLKAASAVMEMPTPQTSPGSMPPFVALALLNGEPDRLVPIDSILYVEACASHSIVYTGTESICVPHTIPALAATLPRNRFFRVNPRFLVSLHHIESIRGLVIRVAGRRIIMTASCKEAMIRNITSQLGEMASFFFPRV